jgi:ferredoxin
MSAAVVIKSRIGCCTATTNTCRGRKPSVRVQAHQVAFKTPQGSEHVCKMTNTQSLLEAALAAGLDVPHLCRTGTCGVCAARALEGSVHREDFLLDDAQSEMGFLLMCSTTVSSDAVIATNQENEMRTLPYGL